MVALELLSAIRDPRHWLSLNPHLTIEAPASPSGRPIPFDVGESPQARAALREEGYVQFDGVLPEQTVAELREGVLRLGQNGWPAVCIFCYDQPWRVFHQMAPIFTDLLGGAYRQLPDLWAWHLEPRSSDAGWKRHRDKAFSTLGPDGAPRSLTAWLALTPATPLNGCIYVLPADRDPVYGRNFRGVDVPDLQDVRALPAGSGTLICWSQALLHWGGRSSRRATVPRISLSCEFQRADTAPYNEPVLDPQIAPAFQHRLALIGLQAAQYRHMQALSPQLEAFVQLLQD